MRKPTKRMIEVMRAMDGGLILRGCLLGDGWLCDGPLANRVHHGTFHGLQQRGFIKRIRSSHCDFEVFGSWDWDLTDRGERVLDELTD